MCGEWQGLPWLSIAFLRLWMRPATAHHIHDLCVPSYFGHYFGYDFWRAKLETQCCVRQRAALQNPRFISTAEQAATPLSLILKLKVFGSGLLGPCTHMKRKNWHQTVLWGMGFSFMHSPTTNFATHTAWRGVKHSGNKLSKSWLVLPQDSARAFSSAAWWICRVDDKGCVLNLPPVWCKGHAPSLTEAGPSVGYMQNLEFGSPTKCKELLSTFKQPKNNTWISLCAINFVWPQEFPIHAKQNKQTNTFNLKAKLVANTVGSPRAHKGLAMSPAALCHLDP